MNQWLEKVDPKSGRTYWGNTKTKVTTWKEPDELRQWRQSTKDSSYWECVDKRTGRMPKNFVNARVTLSESGKAYYIDQRTRESTWHRPLGRVEPYTSSKRSVSTQRQRTSEKTIDIEEKEHGRGDACEGEHEYMLPRLDIIVLPCSQVRLKSWSATIDSHPQHPSKELC